MKLLRDGPDLNVLDEMNGMAKSVAKVIGILLMVAGGLLGAWFWLAGVLVYGARFGTAGLAIGLVVIPADLVAPMFGHLWLYWYLAASVVLLFGGAVMHAVGGIDE
jgi:hypothetical protein